MKKFIILLITIFSLLTCLSETMAAKNILSAPQQTFEFNQFKLQPRVAAWGLAGNLNIARIQGIMPIIGNYEQALFGLAEGNKSEGSNWALGAGIGYRMIRNNQLLGGYLIANEINSTLDNKFFILNPGIEVLGMGATNAWDLKVNGYWAVNNQRLLREGFARDTFNNYSFVRPIGHIAFDHYLKEYEEAGSGGDVRVGRIIPHLEAAKIYLGGYFFNTPNASSIQGGLAKITYDINPYTALELTSTYDNYFHSRTYLGIKITLGDYSTQEKKAFNLSSRLLENIDHGIGDTIVTTRVGFEDLGERQDNRYYVYFIPSLKKANHAMPVKDEPTGDGTFEHPYEGFTPEAVAQIEPAAGLKTTLTYAPGSYDLGVFDFQTFSLPNNWDMLGLESNFINRAEGDRRSALTGGGILLYSANKAASGQNVIDSLQFTGTESGEAFSGILQMNGTSAALHNVTIGNPVAPPAAAIGNIGIRIQSSTLEISDTTIYAYNNIYNDMSAAVVVLSSTVTFSGNNVINATGGFFNPFPNSNAWTAMANGIILSDATMQLASGNLQINTKVSGNNLLSAGDSRTVTFTGIKLLYESSLTSVASSIKGGRTFLGINATDNMDGIPNSLASNTSSVIGMQLDNSTAMMRDIDTNIIAAMLMAPTPIPPAANTFTLFGVAVNDSSFDVINGITNVTSTFGSTPLPPTAVINVAAMSVSGDSSVAIGGESSFNVIIPPAAFAKSFDNQNYTANVLSQENLI